MFRLKQLDTIDHNSLLCVAACALVLFFNLGTTEIQPWDEAQYAIRARVILQHHNWLDQTEHSIGGLYSSTYPPFAVWGIACSMKLFGETPFAVRLFSVLCATLALLSSVHLARKLFDRQTAMVLPTLLCGTLVWNHYARSGMVDVPLMSLALGCLSAVLEAAHARSTRHVWMWSGVFALLFAATLMTKLVVSLLPLCFLMYVAIKRYLDKNLLRPEPEAAHYKTVRALHPASVVALSLASIVAITIAGSWYSMMISRYGEAFSNALLVPHLAGVVENSVKSLGMLYYLNQLIVSHPYSVLSLFYVVMLATRFRTVMRSASNAALELLLAAWFVSALIIFSIAPSKQPHYVLLFILPSLFLALRALELLVSHFVHSRIALCAIASVLVGTAWSSSQALRDSVASILHIEWNVPGFVFVLLCGLALAISLFLNNVLRERILLSTLTFFVFLLPTLLAVRVAVMNIYLLDAHQIGAKKTAQWLELSEANEFVYVVHAFNSSDTLAPALAWYTKGWCGYGAHSTQRADKYFRHVELSYSEADQETLRRLDTVSVPIVYAKSVRNEFAMNAVEQSLARSHRKKLDTPSYVIYSSRDYPDADDAFD